MGKPLVPAVPALFGHLGHPIITYTRLSLDTSLHKPVSALFILPAVFETSNGRKFKA